MVPDNRRFREINTQMSPYTFDSFLTVKCISRYLPTHCSVATVVQEPVWIIETRTVLAPALMTWLRVRIRSSINSVAPYDAKHSDAHLLRVSAHRSVKATPPTATHQQHHHPGPFNERFFRLGSQYGSRSNTLLLT